MIRRILLVLLLAGAACGDDKHRGGKHGRHDNKKDDDRVTDWRVLIDAIPAETGSVAKQLMTHGVLESEAQADITPEAAGVVTRIVAEEGDTVEAGQLLAVLSSPSLEAGADRANVELSRARRNANQAEALHEKGAISDTELLEAKEALETASATHREMTRSSRFARLESPISGTVAVREIRLGELANGAQRAFQVVDLNRLRVVVQMPEKDLALLKPGLSVMLEGAYNDSAQAEGSVARISPVVDPQSGTVRVTIAVATGTTALRPGQFVKARIEVDRHEDVLTVPRRSIFWKDGAPITWRVIDAPPEDKDKDKDKDKKGDDEDGPNFFAKWFADEDEDKKEADPWAGVPRRIVEKVPLEIGYMDTRRAEIVSGLDPEDQVVSIGGDNLRDESPVKLPGDPDPKQPDDDDSSDAADADEGGEEG